MTQNPLPGASAMALIIFVGGHDFWDRTIRTQCTNYRSDAWPCAAVECVKVISDLTSTSGEAKTPQ